MVRPISRTNFLVLLTGWVNLIKGVLLRNSFKTKVLHIYMGYNFTVDFFSVSENIRHKRDLLGKSKISEGPLRVFPKIRDGPFLIINTSCLCEVTAGQIHKHSETRDF